MTAISETIIIALKVRRNIARGNALGCQNNLPASPCKSRIRAAVYTALSGRENSLKPMTNPARWTGLKYIGLSGRK